MRIGFDAKRLFLNNTGLGNYSRTLVKNLCRYHPMHEYVLYSPSAPKNSETAFFFEHDSIEIITPKSGGALWRTFGIKKHLQEYQIDLFHGLSNELPFGIDQLDLASVVTIHDVIYERYPAQYGFIDRRIYRYKTQRAITESSKIISISEQTTRDLETYYNGAQGKCQLIYQSCNDSFVNNIQTQNHSLETFFLSVGSVIERKNLLRILEAMCLIPEEGRKKLIVVGEGGDYYQRCRKYASKNGLDESVEWKGYLGKEALRELYDTAIATIYPSIFEGFGIPVIEALYSGCPVITSNQSSLKEAGGDAAVLIDPHKPKEIAAAMIQMTRSEFRNALFQNFPAHIEKFNPENLSSQLTELYQSLL